MTVNNNIYLIQYNLIILLIQFYLNILFIIMIEKKKHKILDDCKANMSIFFASLRT